VPRSLTIASLPRHSRPPRRERPHAVAATYAEGRSRCSMAARHAIAAASTRPPAAAASWRCRHAAHRAATPDLFRRSDAAPRPETRSTYRDGALLIPRAPSCCLPVTARVHDADAARFRDVHASTEYPTTLPEDERVAFPRHTVESGAYDAQAQTAAAQQRRRKQSHAQQILYSFSEQ